MPRFGLGELYERSLDVRAVAEGVQRPALEVPLVLGHGKRIRQGMTQEPDPPALPYPKSSRILTSIWPSTLLRRDVCQGRSIGDSSIYIFIYLDLWYVAPKC